MLFNEQILLSKYPDQIGKFKINYYEKNKKLTKTVIIHYSSWSPIKSGQINKRVYQPRDLLFSDELSGMPDTLLTNSNPANVLYNLQGLKPSNQTTYGEWTNIFNALADPLAKKNAEGVLGSDLIATRATNPNKTPFWDSGLQFKPKGAYDTKQIRKFIYQDPEYKKPLLVLHHLIIHN
ncbi:putative adhesin P123 [Spiroplasma citri]|nr:putative adhesin P123 [Spiroplasma citri]